MATAAPMAKEVSFQPEPAPVVHPLFQSSTGKWQYIVADPTSRHAVIIDPLLDSTSASGAIATGAADAALAVVQQHGYVVDRILATHAPAQPRHASAAWYLRTQILEATGTAPRVSADKTIAGVQRIFRRKYGALSGDVFGHRDADHSYQDGDVLKVGRMSVKVMSLAADQFGFLIGHNIFAGDMAAAQDLPNTPMGLTDDPANYRVYTSVVDAKGVQQQ